MTSPRPLTPRAEKPTPAEMAAFAREMRELGAKAVRVEVSRGGTLRVEVTWPDDEAPRKPVVRAR